MDNKDEKFLPIGTVVLLKGGTKKAMITGFCSIAAEDKTKLYDYTGCIYPEGYLDFSQICLFDHDQIEQIFHYGYVDDEEKEFKQELNEVVTKYQNGDQEIKSLIDNFGDDEDYDDDDDDDEDDNNSNQDTIIPRINENSFAENTSNNSNNNEELEYL